MRARELLEMRYNKPIMTRVISFFFPRDRRTLHHRCIPHQAIAASDESFQCSKVHLACRLSLNIPSTHFQNCPTHLDPATATHVAKQIPIPLHIPQVFPHLAPHYLLINPVSGGSVVEEVNGWRRRNCSNISGKTSG